MNINQSPATVVNQCAYKQQMSQPSAQISLRQATPNVNFDNQLSSSVPARKTIYNYDARRFPLGKSVSSVSLPANLETTSGKVYQLARLVGYDFYKIDKYDKPDISSHLRIPILEGLFADARQGTGLPTVLDFLDSREQRVCEPCYETGLREEVAETVFFYLHLLLFMHTRGVEHIQTLASYSSVKATLLDYWDCLVKRQFVADHLLKSCKSVLESCDVDDVVAEQPRSEKDVLESLVVCVESVEYLADQKAGFAHHQGNSSFTSHNLVNMLLDFLCLGSKGASERVVNSLPKQVVVFLDEKYKKYSTKI